MATDAHPGSGPPTRPRPRAALHNQIFIGMLAGAALGTLANVRYGGSAGLESFVRGLSYPVGLIFLRLIFMVVIPLILSAIILGVAELGDVRRLGRIGLRTLTFTLVLSSVSVLIGVTLANVIRPGAGMSSTSRAELLEVIDRKSVG